MSETFKLEITIKTPKSTSGESEENRGSIWFDDQELEKFSIISGETRKLAHNIEVDDCNHSFNVENLYLASSTQAFTV